MCIYGKIFIPDVEGLHNSLQDANGMNNNFKIIQQSKSSQGSHLKHLSTKSKATKEFGQ